MHVCPLKFRVVVWLNNGKRGFAKHLATEFLTLCWRIHFSYRLASLSTNIISIVGYGWVEEHLLSSPGEHAIFIHVCFLWLNDLLNKKPGTAS